MSGLNSWREKFGRGKLLRVVVGNTLWQMMAKVFRMLVNLMVGIWVARYLGPTNFGLLNFAIAFVALFTPIADLGVQSIVVRDLVRRPADRSAVLSSTLVLRIVGALLGLGLAVLYIMLSRPHDQLAWLVVAAVAISLVPLAWDVIEFDYQARMDARPIFAIRTISLIVFAVAKGLLIMEKAPLGYFALAVSGEATLSAIMMWSVFRKKLPGFGVYSATFREMFYMMRSSWPLAISSMSVLLYMRIDQVMLGQMVNDKAVGIFSAAVRVSESWLFIPIALLAAASPVLTAELRKSELRYRERLVLFTRIMFFLGLVFAGIVSMWADELVDILYGSKYAGAGDVLRVHAWAGLFATIGLATDPWFVNANMVKIRMMFTAAGAAINIILNLLLIPRYGVFGSAIATLVSYSASGLWLNGLTRKTMPMFLIQTRALIGVS